MLAFRFSRAQILPNNSCSEFVWRDKGTRSQWEVFSHVGWDGIYPLFGVSYCFHHQGRNIPINRKATSLAACVTFRSCRSYKHHIRVSIHVHYRYILRIHAAEAVIYNLRHGLVWNVNKQQRIEVTACPLRQLIHSGVTDSCSTGGAMPT
jgi:hypothetical protein